MLAHLPCWSWLKGYNSNMWRNDVKAGLTVGIMLVPQGMAYATIAGLPVVHGLYAALVPAIVYGIWGTSRHLSVGPVAMDSLLVAAGLAGLAAAGSDPYIALAILLALMVGLAQWTMGFLKLGFLVHFLSRPVISGFTSAAAVLIALHQLPPLLGMSNTNGLGLKHVVGIGMDMMPRVHGPTLALSGAALLTMVALKTWWPKAPGMLIVVGLGLFASWAMDFQAWGIRTLGAVPQGLPSFDVPSLDWEQLNLLWTTALTVAVIGFAEAMGVAKSIEERHAYELDPDRELRALGLSNIAGSMFQSYPTTGGFSRSAVAEQAGGQTPVTSWIAAAVVGLALLFFTPLLSHLPLAVLGAMIVVAVSSLFDLAYPLKLWNRDRIEALILGATFLATLIWSLPLGIGAGILLSLALAVRRMMHPHVAVLGEVEGMYKNVARFEGALTHPDVLLVRYDGALNFANQDHFKSTMRQLVREKGESLKLIVLQADAMPYIDATARGVVESLVKEWEEIGLSFCLSGAIGPVRDAMAADGLLEHPHVRVHLTIPQALEDFRHPGSVPPSLQTMAKQHG